MQFSLYYNQNERDTSITIFKSKIDYEYRVYVQELIQNGTAHFTSIRRGNVLHSIYDLGMLLYSIWTVYEKNISKH
mgnify:FL=1